MIEPELLPAFDGAETADIIAVERGRIITDTRDRLIRLQQWVRGGDE